MHDRDRGDNDARMAAKTTRVPGGEHAAVDQPGFGGGGGGGGGGTAGGLLVVGGGVVGTPGGGTIGGCGIVLSGCTQDDRSKKRNSSAFSCADIIVD